MLQEIFGVLEAMRLLLPKTFLGQCDASWRPDDRVSYMHEYLTFLPIVLYSIVFAFPQMLQIFIGILVLQLTNVTQGNISHIDFISCIPVFCEEKELKCYIALFPRGRIWEVLEGQGDPPMLCSFNLVSSTKSCMRTCSYLTHLIDVQCTLIWILRCLQLKFCNKQKRSFLSQSTPPFLPPNEGRIATDLCWV